MLIRALAVVVMLGGSLLGVQPAPGPARSIALTFDDLPGVLSQPTLEALTDINRRLLAPLRISAAPAIGFVNEQHLEVEGEGDPRIGILRGWLDAGMTLGNHGYAHVSFNAVALADYEADVVRGERVTRALLLSRGKPLTWYRHPFNQTGPDADAKARFETFAREHGYRIAPFTIEAADYLFSPRYEIALAAHKQAPADAIMAAYLQFVDVKVMWGEAFSLETFGRAIPQVLLSHVNRLNADAMPELLRRLRARGYRFISLDEAVQDPAYNTPDEYVGRNGPSWLHRWRVALRKPPRLDGEPDPPDWVMAP